MTPSPEEPLISVVIPTHNRAPLLERALESLTGQSVPRSQFEVVVVDDGSSDWTAKVCERFGEQLSLRRFRIENSGISAAKNLGLFVSVAPLVLWFDDDDLADPALIEAHLEAHRAHPEANVAVLGYTTWAPELEPTPLMEYVTEVGQQLFSYPGIEDGAMLDYTYFWGGRSSCKRSFLTEHGSFDQELPAMEDIELGFRLAHHGLEVFYTRTAKSSMLRAVTFDEFTRRCVKRGRAIYLFDSRHDDPGVERFCRVAESLEKWPEMATSLEAKTERVRELERRHAAEGGLGDEELGELHELYGWTFEAHQARGIAEAAAEASQASPVHRPATGGGRTDPLPAICPNPVFIIGSPRSGTSILAWSLAQHSELATDAETDIFFYMLKDPHLEEAFEISVGRPDGTWLAKNGVDFGDFLAHIGLGLNALLTATAGGLQWVDQTPANTIVVDRLGQMFPEARFIHLLRDGRRVVNSMINFHRTLGSPEALEEMKSAGRLPPWATDFRDACQTWVRLTRIASEFCERHPDRSTTLTNERMITDPGGAMADTLEFIGVQPEPRPAEFLRTQRINSSFVPSGSSEQAPPSLTEPWLEWLPEQRQVFAEVAGAMLVECGFATEAELLADHPGGGAPGNGAGLRTGTGPRSS